MAAAISAAWAYRQPVPADPFRDGERLYRTRDLARRRPDGVLEFVGRRDHQVKLRGHRIELSEIEWVLETLPNVRNAVVQLRDDLPSGEPGLVAYVVGNGEPPADSALRAHLQAKLPAQIIPAHFVTLTELPLRRTARSTGRSCRHRSPNWRPRASMSRPNRR